MKTSHLYKKFLHLYNINGNEPLIVHTNSTDANEEGTIKKLSEVIFDIIEPEIPLECPKNLTVIIVENEVDAQLKTDTCVNNHLLLYQLRTYNIDYINGYCPRTDNKPFDIMDKIEYIYNALKQVETEFVLFLDSRDTKIRTFDNIIELFKTYNTRVLFGAEKGNYGIQYNYIEQHNIQHGSSMKYLNSGCFIGYTKDCLDFYADVYQYKTEYNLNSTTYNEEVDLYSNEIMPNSPEMKQDKHIVFPRVLGYPGDQGVVRKLLNNYNNTYINVDYKSLIFMNTYQVNVYLN